MINRFGISKRNLTGMRNNINFYPDGISSVTKVPDVAIRRDNTATSLSHHQNKLLNLLKSGQNVYFTGKAGSGKTRVLKEYINYLREKRINVAVTAPTGVAASLIQGQTLHSFSSLPISLASFDEVSFCSYVKSKKSIVNRYIETQVLVVDEISMVNYDFFERLDSVCKRLRENSRPFGGIQVVLTGDFFQLPPVSIRSAIVSTLLESSTNTNTQPCSSEFLQHIKGRDYNPKLHTGTVEKSKDYNQYIFQSRTWLDLIKQGMKTVELSLNFRQNDSLLSTLLDDIRFGIHSPEMWDFLEGYKNRHLYWNSGIEPTFLTPYRATAEYYNQTKLRELPGSVHSYQSIDSVRLNEGAKWSTTSFDSSFSTKSIFHSFSATPIINLKKGAKVLLTRNIDVKNNLANGSQGTVVDFYSQFDNLTNSTQLLPVIRLTNGQDYAIGYHDFETRLDLDGITVQRRQIPLQLGWGLTIHRAQGITLDRVIIDMPQSFEPGHAYVAFSRVRSLEGLSIKNFGKQSIRSSDKVYKFYCWFKQSLS